MSGNVFLSMADEDQSDVVPLAKKLETLGFSVYATLGTSTILRNSA